MSNCSPLWFLTALFTALIIYELINMCPNALLKYSSIFMCIFVSYMLSWLEIPKLPWNIDTALMAQPFIEIGNVLSVNQNKVKDFKSNKIVYVELLVILIASVMSAKCNTRTVSFDDNRYGDALFMFMGAVPPIMALMYFCWKYRSKSRFFAWIGHHTLLVMGFDYLSESAAETLLYKVNAYDWASLFGLKMILLIVGIHCWNHMIHKLPCTAGKYLNY